MNHVYTIVKAPEFHLKGEWDEYRWILHCDVHGTWNKTKLTKLKAVLKWVAKTAGVPVYAFQTPSCDPKKRKFILQVGGRLSHTETTENGEKAEMFRFLP